MGSSQHGTVIQFYDLFRHGATHSFTVSSAQDFERLAAFMVVGACISWGAALQRRIRDTSVQNAERLRITLENIGDAVIGTDIGGRIIMMNAVAETLTGWKADVAIGQQLPAVFRLVHETSREEINLRRIDQSASAIRVPDGTMLVSRDGKECPIQVGGTIIERASRACELVLVFRDVSVQRQHEREMEATAEQLRQTAREREALLNREQVAHAQAESENRMKDEFIALVSHELRTPLTSILGWARALRESRRDESLRVGLSSIDRNATLQLQLIEDLLDVSRMTIGSFRLERKNVDVTTIITNAVQGIHVAVLEKRIRVTVNSDPGRTINVDPDRLQQVLWNLLSNAVKFTADGGWIDVSCKNDGRTLTIQVTDNGRGFPAEFQSRLFQRFQQSDRQLSRQGLGLGLSIVRHIVELHGGTVEGRSEGLYKGATFVVTLPVSADVQIPKAAKTA